MWDRQTEPSSTKTNKRNKPEYDENVNQINERHKCVTCGSFCKFIKHLHIFLLYFNYERLVETEKIALEWRGVGKYDNDDKPIIVD